MRKPLTDEDTLTDAGHDSDLVIGIALLQYVDTALTPRTMDAKTLAQAVEGLGCGRVLFGSDLPWADFSQTMKLLQEAASHAPYLDWDAVARKNAEHLAQCLGVQINWLR